MLCLVPAGFTAWSSVRQPAEVFTLLETLYRAFDAIAARHKVFKVETIGGKSALEGHPSLCPFKVHTDTCTFHAVSHLQLAAKDCYVAVCGLPYPRKKHALVMACSALECQTKTTELLDKLVDTLGGDTADLAMR
jgi:class 3 adenylate cyclase